jgi:hypothetical protein
VITNDTIPEKKNTIRGTSQAGRAVSRLRLPVHNSAWITLGITANPRAD